MGLFSDIAYQESNLINSLAPIFHFGEIVSLVFDDLAGTKRHFSVSPQERSLALGDCAMLDQCLFYQEDSGLSQLWG